MALCTVCKGIPTNFFALFTPLTPNFSGISDRSLFHYEHHTPSALRQSAANGCPMCKILECQLNDHWLSRESKDKERLTMKREMFDPEAFGLWMGDDEISHSFYYLMSPKYQQALPKARIDENDNEDLLMRYWINDCIRSHGSCNENQRAHCPTRLLDLVRFRSSGDIVLTEREEHANEHIPYTTLSHCWGAPTSRPLITNLANLASRKSRIPFDELPLTFQDAVTTTRKLNIPYLWIDSLCIIQNSPSDWEKEAGRMAKVYAGSVCTLSALGSKDSNGGFFRVAEKKKDFGFQYDLTLGSQRIRLFPSDPNNWMWDGPLMHRAWTLQERELSKRILHFSPEGLLWECKTLRASADLPWLQYPAPGGDPAPQLLYDSAEELSGQYDHSLMLRRRWFETVEDYSKRNLTNSKDKLIALSGLAHSYYEGESPSGVSDKTFKGGRWGKYAAGLWEAGMPSALLWRTVIWRTRSAQRSLEYRAPSWSWASIDGIISYESQMLKSGDKYGDEWFPDDLRNWLPDDPDYLSSIRDSSEYDFGAFCVQEIETTTSSLDPMGAVSAGHIILTGLVAVAIINEETYTFSRSGSLATYTWLRDPDGLVVGALLADVLSEMRPSNIYCVSVRDERLGALVAMPEELDNVNRRRVGDKFERVEMVMGLGLARIGEEDEKLFMRLGLVRWMRKDLFAGKEVSTIKIV